MKGLNELVRAFQVANKDVAKDVRTAIEQAGEPIREEASQRSRSLISGMSRSRVPWWPMRSGVIRNTIGYVAPLQRGSTSAGGARRKRPNLAPLLRQQEEAALEHNQVKVLAEFEDAMNEMAKSWARV